MMKLKEKLKKRGGFTLIEMLLVVAIVAILVVISIPMMTNSLDKAKKAADDANFRAAKAVAAIEYLTSEGTFTSPQYYDAKNGKLVDNKDAISEGYGQHRDEKDDIIEVTVVTDEGETQGDITCKWVEK